jgi:hypothetical protein
MENISTANEDCELLLDNEVRDENSSAKKSETHDQTPTQRKFTLIWNLMIV